ncbi:hypothetical protein L227DRAFT_617239 [Lentinus tigrinus ALCF2SS1-6]|uniref:Uncharacterized protein n=1 Tax=Lentinus tigrinus ALCF2SS1-6 TaxID=1328759 RepID=A0A5C2RRG7_9APHY|nr:hypothetical protein L227DRAFT_617239 [Lentinus tigrinus ALCF2SS1-6]
MSQVDGLGTCILVARLSRDERQALKDACKERIQCNAQEGLKGIRKDSCMPPVRRRT